MKKLIIPTGAPNKELELKVNQILEKGEENRTSTQEYKKEFEIHHLEGAKNEICIRHRDSNMAMVFRMDTILADVLDDKSTPACFIWTHFSDEFLKRGHKRLNEMVEQLILKFVAKHRAALLKGRPIWNQIEEEIVADKENYLFEIKEFLKKAFEHLK